MKERPILVRAITVSGVFVCQVLAGVPSLAIVQSSLTNIHAHLYVPMALAGQSKSHWWLVDTGSPWSLVNVEQAKQLISSVSGIREASATVGGKPCKELVNIGTILDGYRAGTFDFLEASLSGVIAGNRATGGGYNARFEAGGVLGVNFLARHRAVLNFRSARLFFRADPAASDRAGFEKQGYTHVPIQVTPIGRIEAIGAVGAKSYSFLVDSGSPQTILQSSIKEAAWLFERKGRGVYFAVGQSALAITGRLPGFRLGAQDVSSIMVQFAKLPNLETGFSYPIGGIIGEDFLWTYQAIVDIGGGALYLKPPK
jgi:hypothetical protein